MKRAGISLALVVMLLLGQQPGSGPGRGNRAGGGGGKLYRSVLAAKDRETLQTYLDCFSDQRRVELRAELPQRCGRGWIPFCSR